MKAVVINKFGSADELAVQEVAVPPIRDDQVLVRVAYAGLGKWDIYEREGLFAGMYPDQPSFPYVLGSEGSGEVTAVGKNIKDFKVGDLVYGMASARSPKNGFYAEYTPVDADKLWHIPKNVDSQQAASVALDGGTALRGLQDVLQVKAGDTVMIIGASGGIGHLAIQLAKHIGARVIGVASGQDGVEAAKQLGADEAVDGTLEGAEATLPKEVDAILVTAAGPAVEKLLQSVKSKRIAYPNGVQLSEQLAHAALAYNADYDKQLMETLLHIFSAGKLHVRIAHCYPLGDMAEAHQALSQHHVGRLIANIK